MKEGFYKLHLPGDMTVYHVRDHGFNTGDIIYVKGNKKCLSYMHCMKNFDVGWCNGLVDTEFGVVCFTFPISMKKEEVLEWMRPVNTSEPEPLYRLIRL